jgi:hypothetical protein
MNRKFVAVAFKPQKISRGLLSLRAADTVTTDFCSFIAEICILLFFFASNSKLAQLLIIDNLLETNQIQREFLFNNCIQSQEFCHAQKFPQNLPIFSNQFKRFFIPNQNGREKSRPYIFSVSLYLCLDGAK